MRNNIFVAEGAGEFALSRSVRKSVSRIMRRRLSPVLTQSVGSRYL